MQLTHHPAPGLGDLLPGFFVVPQNPLQPVTYTPRIGEIMPGSFVVPQNPIMAYTTGNVRPIGTGNGISGCGCGGSCGGCGGGKINGSPISGIGDWTTDWANISGKATAGDFMGVLQATVFGVPVWAVGAGLALVMFAGGSEHSYAGRGRRAARAAARAW